MSRLMVWGRIWLLLVSTGAWAHGQPHQHGVMALDVGVTATDVTMQLRSPLDTFVGFERKPRDAAERARADEALGTLRNAVEMFQLDAAAQCVAGKVDITSAALGVGDAAHDAHDHAEHADLVATLEFRCTDARRLRHIDVRLFKLFPGLSRIDVQIAAPTGQQKKTLRRPAQRIEVAR